MTANTIPLKNIREAQAFAIIRLLRGYRANEPEKFMAEWLRLAQQEAEQLERMQGETSPCRP